MSMFMKTYPSIYKYKFFYIGLLCANQLIFSLHYCRLNELTMNKETKGLSMEAVGKNISNSYFYENRGDKSFAVQPQSPTTTTRQCV